MRPLFKLRCGEIILKEYGNDQDIRHTYTILKCLGSKNEKFWVAYHLPLAIFGVFNVFKEKKPLSSNILQLSNKVGMYSNDQFILFLSLIKFIIVHTTKINLGIDIQKNFISDISKSLLEMSKYLDNQISQKILEYLNTYENDLFVYNLDKKIFILNIFSPLSNRI